jgi:AcrR family transcriptional regulator
MSQSGLANRIGGEALARRRSAESRSPGTREKILEAAERLIAAHGPEGFQLKDVADAVGIRPPSVYAHFESRDAICRAVAQRLYDGIVAAVRIDQTRDPMEALLQLLEDYVRYLADRPAHLRLVLRDLAYTAFPSEDPETPSMEEAWQAMSKAFRALVQRGIDAGRFRPLRPDSVQAQLVGAIATNLCWGGWDEAGNPIAGVPIEEIVRESQDLAVRLLRASDD